MRQAVEPHHINIGFDSVERQGFRGIQLSKNAGIKPCCIPVNKVLAAVAVKKQVLQTDANLSRAAKGVVVRR